jgi:hypothetical protein
VSGYSGNSGYSGVGASGYSGIGTSGYSGISGYGGQSGYSGVSGYSGIGISGYSGQSGYSGVPALGIVYNVVSRYSVVTAAGLGVWVTSSSQQFSNLNWSRSTTTLTINHNGHGRSSGERVIVRGVNVDYINATIVSVAANSFTVTCADAGSTFGVSASYTLGFTFSYNAGAGSILSSSVIAPVNANVVLLSLRIHLAANTRSTTTFDIQVPNSSINGGGDNTGNDDVYWPTYMVRQDSDSMPGVGATIAKNVSGNFSIFRLGALSNTAVGQSIALSW